MLQGWHNRLRKADVTGGDIPILRLHMMKTSGNFDVEISRSGWVRGIPFLFWKPRSEGSMLFRGLVYERVTSRASREGMERKVMAKRGCAA